jgi:class 3 adenylate cyclase
MARRTTSDRVRVGVPWGGPVGVRDGNFCWGPRRLGHPRNAAMLLSSVSSGGDVVFLEDLLSRCRPIN